MKANFELVNGWERALESPDTFELPEFDEVEALSKGDIVKLIFSISFKNSEGEDENKVERMWVEIADGEFPLFDGILTNTAFCTEEIKAGLQMKFEAQHIIDIYEG